MPILFRFYMPHPTQIGKTIASRNNLFNNAWTSVLLHCTKIKPQNRPIRSSNLEKWMMIEPTYRNANQNGLPTLIFTVATPFMVEFNGPPPSFTQHGCSMKQFRVPTLGMPQSSSIDFYQSDTVCGVSSAVKICNALIPPFSFFVRVVVVTCCPVPHPQPNVFENSCVRSLFNRCHCIVGIGTGGSSDRRGSQST